MLVQNMAAPWRTDSAGTCTAIAVYPQSNTPFIVEGEGRPVDLANVHARLRIRSLELHPDNPIIVSTDYHTDQPDPVWVMKKKGTRLELGVRKGEAAKKSAV